MSAALLRQGRIEAIDAPLLADEAPLPPDGRCRVSLARWQAEPALAASGRVGVQLPNTADVQALAETLQPAWLIALEFPGFADGRAYSQARLLRQRLDYRGELRAVGKAVVRDQLPGLARCGFDSFELREDQDPEACRQTLGSARLAYQPAVDALPWALRLRRPGGA
ncbi:MAG TPA: DUF934 domain-containing protein [Nevskiaceae bacterium]|nr:DUF934 domain-containing protein [Nevskiaceae bacterium]